MKKYEFAIALVAIIAITIVEIFAIVYQMDGRALALALAVLAGLGGYELAIYRKK